MWHKTLDTVSLMILDTTMDIVEAIDIWITKKPKLSYILTVTLLWFFVFSSLIVWCLSLGPSCFLCEYAYFNDVDGLCESDVDLSFHVTFVNLCPELIFLGASGPTTVMPSGQKWHLQQNEQTVIYIPDTWMHTQGGHKVGPRFWARTGCRFNSTDNKAQCEVGDCGNHYDCSKANLAGKAPASLAEFCFVCGDNITYYDVSLVDGYSVSIDITPGAHSAHQPGDLDVDYWCKSSLCNPNKDLRTSCPDNFVLKNSDLASYNPIDPVMKVACFSNCGKFEYPTAPNEDCPESDPICAQWRMYCCQAPTYGKHCTTDADCTDGGACWGNTCQCKAYYRNPPCADNVCTNQFDNSQPVAGSCSDCIGDDHIHQVCPRAYSWPNDPQTYGCDATDYTVTFCPGGTVERISTSVAIPKCDSLNESFAWKKAQVNCANSHGKYLCALQNGIWDCNVDNAGCNYVLCSWPT